MSWLDLLDSEYGDWFQMDPYDLNAVPSLETGVPMDWSSGFSIDPSGYSLLNPDAAPSLAEDWARGSLSASFNMPGIDNATMAPQYYEMNGPGDVTMLGTDPPSLDLTTPLDTRMPSLSMPRMGSGGGSSGGDAGGGGGPLGGLLQDFGGGTPGTAMPGRIAPNVPAAPPTAPPSAIPNFQPVAYPRRSLPETENASTGLARLLGNRPEAFRDTRQDLLLDFLRSQGGLG